MEKQTTNSIFSFFWNCVKPYKWYFLLMYQAPIISAFYTPTLGYGSKLLIDSIVENNTLTWEIAIFPIILIAGSRLFMSFLFRVSSYARLNAMPYVKKSITEKAYAYALGHSYTFFQNNFSGEVSKRVNSLQDHFESLSNKFHYGIMWRISAILLNTIVLFSVSVYLGLATISLMLLLIPIARQATRDISKLSENYSYLKNNTFGFIADGINNVVSLFLFASREKELDISSQKLQETAQADAKVQKRAHYFYMIMDLLFFLYILSSMSILVHLKTKGLVSAGDFSFVLTMSMHLLGTVFVLINETPGVISSFSELKETFKTFKKPQEMVDHKDAKDLKFSSGEIKFSEVTFGYEHQAPVFDKFQLTIAPGEKVGLVGHSGAGKSSFVSLLLRYFDVNSGAIMVAGEDIRHVTQDSLRAHISVIPQDPLLFHRTLLENIRYGRPTASMEEVIEVSKKAHIHEFITTLKDQYETEVGERGIKLSGGQRQRIAIARAMLKNAPILILDEATSSLDSQTEQKIQESLHHLIADKKITVIAIAHRLSTLKNMNRIIVMNKGKIAQEGTHDTLLEEGGLYKNLWESQVVV